MALKGAGLSSPSVLDHLAAAVTTGQSLLVAGDHVAVWTCIPASPGADVGVVPLIMSKRVGVRVAGTALLDGRPETAVTRQWKYSPRCADLYSKLV